MKRSDVEKLNRLMSDHVRIYGPGRTTLPTGTITRYAYQHIMGMLRRDLGIKKKLRGEEER